MPGLKVLIEGDAAEVQEHVLQANDAVFDPAGTGLASVLVGDAIKEVAASTRAGCPNFMVSSLTPFSTSAASDTLVTGFTYTPPSGTYLVLMNFSVDISSSVVTASFNIYLAGTIIARASRTKKSAVSNNADIIQLLDIITVNGTQAVDLRVSISGGSLTINDRTMVLARLHG
jgi:hypothetical protein